MDIQEQINELKQQDTPESQVKLGILYSEGPAIVRDCDEAIICFEKAAQSGNSDAMFYLGLLYSRGVGVKKDFALVASFLKQALALNNGKAYAMAYSFNKRFGVLDLSQSDMEQVAVKAKELLGEYIVDHADDGEALYCLGLLLSKGPARIVNEKQAACYLSQGCKLNNASALIQLASLYRQGLGVPQSMVKAQKLLDKAIELDSAQAMLLAGHALLDSQSPKDFKKAAQYFERAVALGHSLAMVELAELYEEGKGVSKNISKTLELLDQALAMNEDAAMLKLAHLYLDGDHVPQDTNKAIELFEQAGKYGNGTALNNLGMTYVGGLDGVTKDRKKGIVCLEKSCDLGDIDAMFNLACVYMQDKELDKAQVLLKKASDLGCADAMTYLAVEFYGVDPDTPADRLAKAKELVTKAASLGNASANYLLANMYLNGTGVKQNIKQAITLLERATDLGEPEAIALLGYLYLTGDGVPRKVKKATELLKQALNEGSDLAQRLFMQGYFK